MPRPAGGVAKKWRPPTKGTTPTARNKRNNDQEV